MKVHFRAGGKAAAAPCGYVFDKRLLGLDGVATWNKRVATPVSCLDCLLFHKPKTWKIPAWEGVGKKARS